MIAIWKETINLEDLSDHLQFMWPQGSEVLSAAVQYPGQIAIWYRCEPNRAKRGRTIHVVGTGHLAPPLAKFIATVILSQGALVLHLFDQGE